MAGEGIGRFIERRFGQHVMVRKAGDVIGGQIPGDALVLNPFPVTVLRTTDLLLLRFSFRNLHWVKVDGADALARRDAGKPAYLIADFPPQHLVEEAFAERASTGKADKKLFEREPQLPIGSDENWPKPKPQPKDEDDTLVVPPVQASLSQHSRLVFEVERETILWSLDGLLAAMSRLPLSVAPHAKKPTHTVVFDRKVIDVFKKADVIKQLADDRIGAVPAIFQAVGRSAAAARVLDHHLGSAVGAEVTSTSRLAVRLKLPPGLVTKIPAVLLRPKPAAPTTVQTSIELPWRLQISPHSDSGFTHASAAVEHDERVELWHSRLGVRAKDDAGEIHIDEDKSEARTVRAVWARDMVPPLAPKTFDAMGKYDQPDFTMALTSNDRRMLVDESSNFTLKRGKKLWDPPAVDVDLLMLTALGGWLRSEFDAPVLPNGQYSITEWKHRAAMGRDHEVKVVYAGFLFPFGHPASLIKITERKIDTHPTLPGRYAYLRQRFFIVVRQQTMTYPESSKKWTDDRDYCDSSRHGEKQLGLAMPFSSVSILTRVTPDLDSPSQEPGMDGAFCFFPSVDKTPFPFKILATDREDQMVEYGGPLMFVGRERNVDLNSVAAVTETYWKASAFKREHRLGGQRVAFAAALGPSDEALDTTLAVDTLRLDAAPLEPTSPDKQDKAQFWPILRTADVVVPAMNALAGVATTTTVMQPTLYLKSGFKNNQIHVFLEVDGVPTTMSFAQQADRSGGFATPNLAVTGLSGSKGPIGGPIDDAINGTMDATKFFGGLPIPGKLFGVVKLSELLEDVGLTPDNMPTFVAKGVNQVTGFLDDVARIDAMAGDVQTRFAAEADAGIQTLRTELAAVQGRAQAVLTAFADVTSLAGAEAAITQLSGGLGDLKQAIDGATALPSGLRGEAAGVVQRLIDYAAAGQEIVGLAKDLLNGVQLPETVGAKLSWSTALAPWPSGGDALFQPQPKAGEGDAAARATLDLCVEVQAPVKPGAEPTTITTCSITPFTLRLLGKNTFIALAVEVIEFTVRPGRKPDVNVVLGSPPVRFGGPLRFVDNLRNYIEPDAFSDPPYLDVDAQGIRAGFDLALPDIQVGAMSLSNVRLAAQANVPFIGDSLDFTFSFGTRENPFRITVWLFGGGGFFGISITPDRCRMLEAALEFGAAAAINLGVASGNVEYMAGIYFKLQPNTDGDEGQLSGYYRARGEVDVLGLLTESIELYMELNYNPADNTAGGRASLTIEVEVANLSKSVTLTLEKKFQGSNLDPSFEEMMSVPSADGTRAWDEYCDAFAAD